MGPLFDNARFEYNIIPRCFDETFNINVIEFN